MGRATFALAFALWSVAAQAQPNTLTLACKGTMTDTWLPEVKHPVSMGLIVNFTARTIQGFGDPGTIDIPVKITGANDATVSFSGEQRLGPIALTISGTIDRVTGDVDATTGSYDPGTSKTTSGSVYALQCRPTQRMF
jgi:hypothetical protein